jgi:hypothetical protein
MRIQPAPGVVVLHPTHRTPISELGIDVVLDSFWLRRLRAGDVVEAVVSAPAEVVQVSFPIPDSSEE